MFEMRDEIPDPPQKRSAGSKAALGVLIFVGFVLSAYVLMAFLLWAFPYHPSGSVTGSQLAGSAITTTGFTFIIPGSVGTWEPPVPLQCAIKSISLRTDWGTGTGWDNRRREITVTCAAEKP